MSSSSCNNNFDFKTFQKSLSSLNFSDTTKEFKGEELFNKGMSAIEFMTKQTKLNNNDYSSEESSSSSTIEKEFVILNVTCPFCKFTMTNEVWEEHITRKCTRRLVRCRYQFCDHHDIPYEELAVHETDFGYHMQYYTKQIEILNQKFLNLQKENLINLQSLQNISMQYLNLSTHVKTITNYMNNYSPQKQQQ
jgi:hypothetical protein